jgi:putative ABC transport system substrate-binding protein
MLDQSRRNFIALLGGASIWPLVARAQQPKLPVIGFLGSTSAVDRAPFVAAFRQGLKETGFVEGLNAAIEYRWAEGQYQRLPELAAELVRLQVRVIAAVGGTPAALAAKAATTTVPIVFSSGEDPVKLGLAASFNRPGGNATGVHFWTNLLVAKRLGILHELSSGAPLVAALGNPKNELTASMMAEVETAARAIGLSVHGLHASNGREIDAAFATMIQQRASALIVLPDTVLTDRRVQIVTLATRHALPAIYPVRESALAGGLMSYGVSVPDLYRQVGVYAGRILKGEKPADLPIVQPTKFELVINLNSARALGIEIPPALLARADEVIE